MDQDSATSHEGEATPIFTGYRRGYDPDQVDRFVADQRSRLDQAQQRASDAERKLAAAVGQLRELHRRVAMLESEERPASPQPATIDTLGERVQRILQEAWEGAHALRQNAEQEIAESRKQTEDQAEQIIAVARRKAEAIEEEIERRRSAYLERIEEDRARAVAQMTYLSDQRKTAVKELLHVRALIETTLHDIVSRGERSAKAAEDAPPPVEVKSVAPTPLRANGEEAVGVPEPTERPGERPTMREELPKTMPVHRLPTADWTDENQSGASGLVRSHRENAHSPVAPRQAPTRQAPPQVIGLSAALGDQHQHSQATVFDFDEEQSS